MSNRSISLLSFEQCFANIWYHWTTNSGRTKLSEENQLMRSYSTKALELQQVSTLTTAPSLGYRKYHIGLLTYQRHYIRASQYYNYPALPNWPRHYRKRKRLSPRSGWPGPAPLPPGRPSWAGWGTCRRSCILKKTKQIWLICITFKVLLLTLIFINKKRSMIWL